MYEITMKLESHSGKCLYEQIYEYIRQEIKEGKLLAGERLPSTRSLAEHLQVARSTADYAYSQLLSEGYIEAKPCKGFFVCPLESALPFECQAGESAQESGTPAGERNTCGEEVRGRTGSCEAGAARLPYDFSPNGIDMSGFPFGVWRRINKNILNNGNSELFSRGDPQGDWGLRCTISRYLHSSRGVSCVPEQIIVGAGNDYLLMLLEKILGHGRRVAMENPTYKQTWKLFQSFGYDVAPVGMDESGMRVPELSGSGADIAYIMPSHQFPTGIVMPIGRRTELLRWVGQGEDRFLIEDDYDSEFRYRGKPIPALQGADAGSRVIYVGTFSKAIAPAIRVSYMVLPWRLLEKYRRECYFYSCTVSRIDQSILDEFIRDGYFERHLNKMRKIYRGKHDLLLECLEPFEKRFRVSGEHAGLHLLLTEKGRGLEDELIESAAEAGVKVYGMSENLVDKEGSRKMPATVLIGFGGLSSGELLEGTERLKKAWLKNAYPV